MNCNNYNNNNINTNITNTNGNVPISGNSTSTNTTVYQEHVDNHTASDFNDIDSDRSSDFDDTNNDNSTTVSNNSSKSISELTGVISSTNTSYASTLYHNYVYSDNEYHDIQQNKSDSNIISLNITSTTASFDELVSDYDFSELIAQIHYNLLHSASSLCLKDRLKHEHMTYSQYYIDFKTIIQHNIVSLYKVLKELLYDSVDNNIISLAVTDGTIYNIHNQVIDISDYVTLLDASIDLVIEYDYRFMMMSIKMTQLMTIILIVI